ncbi:MAG: hypothetical protein RL095_1347 [Verrucomicrobiota bacterium]
MGGQQFLRGEALLDMRECHQVLAFDREQGRITVEAGIEWPRLIRWLQQAQAGDPRPWTIRQKQTGVDRVTLGGSAAANAHGRGLNFAPVAADVEDLLLIDAEGRTLSCSRKERPELFSLVLGGYGLFGVIAALTLRLVPRQKLRRQVQIIAIQDLLPLLDRRLEQGFLYGDCQYATDLGGDPVFHHGVFPCYGPVDDDTPMPQPQEELAAEDWVNLYRLARSDKKEAFDRYFSYYLRSHGQVYWSDEHQLAGSFEEYRRGVDVSQGTEMITEVYVDRDAFLPFLATVREDFVRHQVDMTYGTIRFIAKDEDSFLPWAARPRVCIVCNLHVRHSAAGIAKAKADFRRILDRVMEFDGSFFLTYHRWAERRHLDAAHPRLRDFLRMKRAYDPSGFFSSDWHRHQESLFAGEL